MVSRATTRLALQCNVTGVYVILNKERTRADGEVVFIKFSLIYYLVMLLLLVSVALLTGIHAEDDLLKLDRALHRSCTGTKLNG